MGQLSVFNDDDDDEEEEAVAERLLIPITVIGGSEPAGSGTATAACSNVLGGLTGTSTRTGALHSGQLE